MLSSLLTLVLLSGDGVPVAASQLACVVHTASVARVTRVPRVMGAALFLLLVFVDCFCQSRRLRRRRSGA